MQLPRKIFSIFTAAGLLLQAAAPAMAQQSGQSGRNEARIQVTSELVLVNVVAHDKKGNLVRDLKKGDFTLLEDGRSRTFPLSISRMWTSRQPPARRKQPSRVQPDRARCCVPESKQRRLWTRATGD